MTAETTAFQRSLNDRVRQIWTRSKWPPLTAVVQKTPGAVDTSTLKETKAVRIDNASDLYDVWSVWDKNPYTDNTAGRIDFSLVDGYIVLNKDESASTIFVVGSQVPANDYGTGTTTIPAFMERMLLAYALADFYRSDQQTDRALSEEQRAEEYLQQELDRLNNERAEQRKSLVSTGDRSAKIRTYNYPQGRVTDHRINLTLYDLSNIIDGDIQKIIDELQLVSNTEKLKEAGESF